MACSVQRLADSWFEKELEFGYDRLESWAESDERLTFLENFKPRDTRNLMRVKNMFLRELIRYPSYARGEDFTLNVVGYVCAYEDGVDYEWYFPVVDGVIQDVQTHVEEVDVYDADSAGEDGAVEEKPAEEKPDREPLEDQAIEDEVIEAPTWTHIYDNHR